MTENKARYWTAVMYPESMIENWKECIDDILQYPFSYCIHDKDKDSKGKSRKEHVHIILVFPNTTTYKHALSIFNGLGKVNKIERVISIRHAYDYLIHDTENSKKKNKYQYDRVERIEGNGFDIGAYEQLSLVDKHKLLKELVMIVKENDFRDFAQLSDWILFVNEDSRLQEVFLSNQMFFNNYLKGLYYRRKEEEAV